MTALLTVAELRGLVASGLDDDALELLLRAEEQAIAARFGDVGVDVTETHIGDGRQTYLVLRQPTSAIVTVVERDGSTDTTLAADDYEVRGDDLSVRRRSDGTNSRTVWAPRVTVTHTPLDNRAERIRVVAALVALDLNYDPGITSEQIGSWLEQKAANSVWRNDLEREAILASLGADHQVGWA